VGQYLGWFAAEFDAHGIDENRAGTLAAAQGSPARTICRNDRETRRQILATDEEALMASSVVCVFQVFVVV
jgi:hypothetical protein